MKIIIFGSTGNTGLELVQQALARGHEVLAFARDPQKMNIQHPKLQCIQGDVMNVVAVQQAVQGVDAAISVLGVRMGQAPSTLRSRGTQNIVDALQAAGVRRLVSCSTVGAGEHLSTLPWLARFLLPKLIGKWRLEEAGLQEKIIRQSQLDWVILRPPRLVDGKAKQVYQLGNELKTGFGSQLSRTDLASALLDQLEKNDFLRQAPTVC